MVVCGGVVPTGNHNPRINLNDVWRLNGGLTWTALKPTGTPPTARFLHSAVFDVTNNRMIVFGGGEGNTSPCTNDVWVLTNSTGKGVTPAWVQLAPNGALPTARGRHGAAYDPHTHSIIEY